MMKRIAIFTLLVPLLWGSCAEDNRNRIAVEKVIQEEVGKRVANYRENRMRRCYEDAVREASALADSILLLEARLTRDTASKPPRPSKPERPALKKLKDSLLQVAPFLRTDSLLRKDSTAADTATAPAEEIRQ